MVNVAIKEETKFKYFRCFNETDVQNRLIEVYEELTFNADYGFVPDISDIADHMMGTYVEEGIMRQVAYGGLKGPLPSQEELVDILERDDEDDDCTGYDGVYNSAMEMLAFAGTFGSISYHEDNDASDSIMQMEFISDLIFILEKNQLCYTKPTPLEGVSLGNIAESGMGFVEVANNPLQEVW